MSQLLWPKGKLLAITSKIYRKLYPFLGNQMSKCQLELTEIILLALHKTYRYSTCLHSMPWPVFKKKKVWGFLSLFRTITIFSKCQLELTEIILLALHKTYRYSTCLHSMPWPVFKKKKVWGFLSLFRTITIFSFSKMLLMTHSVVPPIKNISGS